MDARLFTEMLSDKNHLDLKKLQYKYSAQAVAEFIALLKASLYKPLAINDFNGSPIVYLENLVQLSLSTVKLLLSPQLSGHSYGIQAMEDEIHSTFNIENINSSRESIRRILNGYAPADDSENRIYGMKRGLDFISNPENRITEENLYKLYHLTVEEYLEPNDRLLPGNRYRHDTVFIVGGKVEHEGLSYRKLPEYMGNLITFIQADNMKNDLLKAAAIHFYMGYLHPYFDGNGRMARLVHLWYLVQQGYPAAMFIPFSHYVNTSRREYYEAYTLVEQNEKLSGVLDITPFLIYFVNHVYNQIAAPTSQVDILSLFQEALKSGRVTEREKDLWCFVLSAYGANEFSTKQLEKDFRNAAYATIRGFVLKFEELGLLTGQRYGSKVKYRANIQ